MTFNVYRQLDQLPFAHRGIALGVFDGVHKGHRHLISMLKCRCEDLSLRSGVFTFSYEMGVGFNERKVNHDFLMTDDEKIDILHGLGVKDVFLIPLTSDFCHLNKESFLRSVLEEKLHVRLLAIGEDGRFGWKGEGDAAYLREYSKHHQLEPLIVPDLTWKGKKVTSTRIREALMIGHVVEAAKMMARTFRLQGTVVSGSHLGSRIGSPTANFVYPLTSVLLRRGVYATRTRVDGGERLPSISNVGVAPSVREKGSDVVVETHIYDYAGNLYGRKIDVEFKEFIRDECVFSSVHDLSARVRADLDAVRAWHQTIGAVQFPDASYMVE
ncbi:MAG TPA: riboflavin biosynthesis protein RibF [Clostridiaceae bacterium]|jgi:riboflavin kinase/FMN adenylyltransferase|nr:riboflavin biosynthesis protein RibF [Clostridiaceae bacterium]